MKIIDRLVRNWGEGFIMPKGMGLSGVHRADFPQRPFDQATKLKIQNVADYMNRGNSSLVAGRFLLHEPSKGWDWVDFPCPMPPWDLAYAEWVFRYGGMVATHLGAFVQTQALTAEQAAAIYSPVRFRVTTLLLAADEFASALTYFLDADGELCRLPFDSPLYAEVAKHGQVTNIEGADSSQWFLPHTIAFNPHGLAGRSIEFAERRLLTINLLFPLILAFSFCNCREVTVKDDEVPEKLLKKAARRGLASAAFDKFKILEIEPLKKTLSPIISGEAEGSVARALHLVRRNRAIYTADAPLFGKYVGLVWRAQHMRGDSMRGAVHKDYSVKPPKDENGE